MGAKGAVRTAEVLRGRHQQCSELEECLTAAHRGTVVVRIDGEPGAGKSALCRHVGRVASSQGMRVVAVVGTQGEADLPLAGLSALLRPLVPWSSALPPGQRRIVRAAAGLCDEVVTDRFALGAATLGLLGAVAEDGPLLLVVDDCHWLDESSVEALAFAARRLDADAVLLLLAARAGSAPPALADLGAVIEVPGLPPDALAEVLADVDLAVVPGVLDAVHAATGGLPLPALETAGALSASERAGRDPLPDPLPVGRRVTETYRSRLLALPERSRLALAVVVVAGSAFPGVLTDALAGAGVGFVDLEPVEDVGVLSLAANGEAVFTHPLMRAAAFELLPPSARRAAHRALAAVTVDDPERHARHLLGAATDPSEDVAGALESAAWTSQRRAGPAPAATLFAQAARATPERERRADRHLHAAQAFCLAGRPDDARREADEVLAAATDPRVRCDAHTAVLASALWGPRSDEATRDAVEEAQRIAPLDPARAARLLVLASSATASRGHLDQALVFAETAFHLTDHDEVDPAARSSSRDLFTTVLVLSGRHPDARKLLTEQGTGPDPGWGPGPLSEIHAVQFPSVVQTLVRLECLDDAEERVRALHGICAEGAAPSATAYVQACVGELRWWQGRWAEALSAGGAAVGLAAATGQEVLGQYAHATTARVQAALGLDRDCRASVAAALRDHPPTTIHPLSIYALSALGLLELGGNDLAAAVPLLRRAEEIRQASGCRDPRAVPFGPDLVEALVRTGDPGAAAALDEYTGMAERSDTAWGQATAARCRALAARDHDDAEVLFATALDHHARSASAFDTARTRLCWGERRRRARDITGSRPLLDAALDTFHALGARLWADRAAAELRAAGGRPRHHRAPELANLSPQELRCALAAAEGLSNRDAAAMLYLSPKTVEYHLGKVFVKLGVTSRTQLARALVREDPA